MPGGRPCDLTPDLIARVCDLLRCGNYRDPVALTVGIQTRTFKRWMKLGSQAGSGLYWQFYHSVHSAEAEAETSAVDFIYNADNETKTENKRWWLMRKCAERWGRDSYQTKLFKKKLDELAKMVTGAEAQPA